MSPSYVKKVARNLPRHEQTSSKRISGSLPIPGKCLKLSKILEILKKPVKCLDSVPLGKKNNVFFVIDNSDNVRKKEACLSSYYKYYDDCGRWDSIKGSHSMTYYIPLPDGKGLRMVRKRNNLFCKKETGKWLPLDPQPDKDSMINVHRYFTQLLEDENYKRRITIASGKDYDSCAALYEYCNTVTLQNLFYGNSRKRKKNIPTNSKVVKKIVKKRRDTSVKHVEENKLNDELASKVTNEKRALLTMLAENPRVQAVINTKDKPSCVILYCDEDFNDMRRNLECENVLGVDCSHKFGDCFVTMTIYQNSRALHKDTNEPLVYLGPVFLHWDEEFLTYVHFFSHIIDKLGDIELDFEVKLGNESGLSLFKALKHFFPASEYILNYHHLKDTVTKKLHNVCESKTNECSMIFKKIFGSEGLIASTSKSVFLERASDLTCYLDEFPTFRDYFGELESLFYEYVCEPQQMGVLPRLWVNGNDEVLNHCLKSVLQQKPYRLSELVEKLTSISKIQMQNLEDT